MKTSIRIFIPVALAILLGSLTVVFSQTSDDMRSGGQIPPTGRDFGPPPEPAGLDPRMVEQLSLNDLQKLKIRAISFNTRDLTRESEGKMRAADEQLRMMVESGNFSEASAQPLARAKAEAMANIELARLRTDAAIVNILTAEQKAHLARLRSQRRSLPPDCGFGPEGR